MSINSFIDKATKRIKKNSSIKEEDTESRFCKYAKDRGCVAIKLIILNRRGFPDRTVLCPTGIIFFIEFKKKNKLPTAPQTGIRDMLTRLGFKWYLCDEIGQAEKILDKILEDNFL